MLDGAEAHEIGLKRGDRPLPTDAATLPNGDVLLVERHYSPMAGVSIQYKRITVAEIDAALATGDPVAGTVIARFGGGYTIDNMEALATRVTEAGDVLIYVMSDNNFSRRQQSLLMVYRLRAD